jgi:type IV secretion system protein VirB11
MEADASELFVRDLGPAVMALFDRKDVTELGVNPGSDAVWIDSHAGGMERTDVRLAPAKVRSFLNRAANRGGYLLTEDNPRLECEMPLGRFGGARLSGSIPPIVTSPGFCLRKFSDEVIPLTRYVSDEIMTPSQHEALVQALHDHDNIFIVGATGSGKTTLAESLLNKLGELYPNERVVTMEDTYELSLPSMWNVYPMKTQTRGDYTQLIEMAMRYSPDRIVVGESRGRSLLHLFDALLSGHEGGISTFHASTVEGALRRMLLYCLRDSDTQSHRQTIGDAVDLMVIIERNGSTRSIKRIARIRGYHAEQGYHIEDVGTRTPAPAGQDA